MCNQNIDQFFVGTGLEFEYGFSAGTSWSAPAIAGAAAVVRKWYRNVRSMDPPEKPSPAMTKAILINGARDIYGGQIRNGTNFTGATVQHITHDPYQGWGSLNLERLLGSGTNYYFHDQNTTLQQGGTTFWEVALTVRNGSKPIRITLVYTDAPSAVSADLYSARNDLTLGAYETACFPCWYGNNISASTGNSTTGTARDSRNNVEQIIIPAGYYATGSTVRVFVNADNLVADGLNPDNAGAPFRQDFAVFVDNLN